MQDVEFTAKINKILLEKKAILIHKFNEKMGEIETLNIDPWDKNTRKIDLISAVIEGALISGANAFRDIILETQEQKNNEQTKI